MTSLTFPELRAQMFKHYFAGEYAEALAIVDAHIHDFPLHRSHTLVWQVCLQAVTGQTGLALQTLQSGLDQGFWYAPSVMRGDSDLASLQGNPEFERMVAHCVEHYEEARRRARPRLTVEEPEEGAAKAPYPVLVAIHGRGGSAAETSDMWCDLVDRGWLVALPQSSQLTGQDAFCWDDHELAEVEITAHIQTLRENHAIDENRLVLAGFSQGAGMAVSLAIGGKTPAAGFIGIAPYLRHIDDLLERPALELVRKPRGYLVTGGLDRDDGLFEKLEKLLKEREIPYQRDHYAELTHDYPPDFPIVRDEALKYILGA